MVKNIKWSSNESYGFYSGRYLFLFHWCARFRNLGTRKMSNQVSFVVTNQTKVSFVPVVDFRAGFCEQNKHGGRAWSICTAFVSTCQTGMVTFFKDSLERKTSGLFLQRFCGFVLGQSSYDVVFLSALAACSGENRLCKISRQSVLTLKCHWDQNFRIPCFYIFEHSLWFLVTMPNFNLLRRLEVAFFGRFLSSFCGRHYWPLFRKLAYE